MSFRISEFRNNVKIVRPNLFKVTCYLPTALSSSSNTFNTTFSFRCEATEFPGRSVATKDDVSFGPTRKLAYDVTYNDINLQIIASTDMNERKIFDRWIDLMVTPGYNGGDDKAGGLIKYYDSYSGGRFVIDQLSESGKVIARCTLFNAFPIAMSPMNLSWAEDNTYQRFNVTLNYRYHTNEFASDQSADAGPSEFE